MSRSGHCRSVRKPLRPLPATPELRPLRKPGRKPALLLLPETLPSSCLLGLPRHVASARTATASDHRTAVLTVHTVHDSVGLTLKATSFGVNDGEPILVRSFSDAIGRERAAGSHQPAAAPACQAPRLQVRRHRGLPLAPVAGRALCRGPIERRVVDLLLGFIDTDGAGLNRDDLPEGCWQVGVVGRRGCASGNRRTAQSSGRGRRCRQ